MATLGLTVANDISNAALTFYVRGETLSQTMTKKPLLAALKSGQKTFPSGKDYVSSPVQGQYMSDTPGFLQGYTQDDGLNFGQAANILRVQYPWKEVHAGLIITWTELKQDGISITDNQKTSEHADVALTRLTGILENRLDDYGESIARAMNNMLWADGSQDAKQVPGIQSILLVANTTGTTGGLSRATYNWWRNRQIQNIAASGANQTLTKTLRSEIRHLHDFGGNPNTALCGSQFIEALELELTEKGLYTQEGFANEGKTDLGVADIRLRGLGRFQYDPTMDILGMAKKCYIFDSKRLRLRPMEDEDMKMLTPERPYQYMVFLKSLTWTGALECTQLNACGIYSIA